MSEQESRYFIEYTFADGSSFKEWQDPKYWEDGYEDVRFERMSRELTPNDMTSLGEVFGQSDTGPGIIHQCGKIVSIRVIKDPPEPRRASGDCVCEVCGDVYRRHPMDHRQLNWNKEPWLRVLCNGDRVHL